MPVFKRADAEIHYEVRGSGYRLLLFAPAGLRRAAERYRPVREPRELGRDDPPLRQGHAGARANPDRSRHPDVRPQYVRRRLRFLREPQVRESLPHAALAAARDRHPPSRPDQRRDRRPRSQPRSAEGLARPRASRRVDPPGHRLPDPPHAVVMTARPYHVYVIQAPGERDFSDCQAALAHVPARMSALPFIGDADELMARTRDADALVVAFSPVTRAVMG